MRAPCLSGEARSEKHDTEQLHPPCLKDCSCLGMYRTVTLIIRILYWLSTPGWGDAVWANLLVCRRGLCLPPISVVLGMG